MTVAVSTWHVELDLFRGPLHTLLDLIERRELPVARVSLVAVADQYLALVRDSPALDLDLTAEFLHVAARLLLLKSQALLPRTKDDEPRDPDGGEEDLEARLVLYRRYRDGARSLAARQESGASMVGRRAPADATLPPPTAGVAIDAARLRRAAVRAFNRATAARRARTAAPRPLIPFTQVLHLVVERLRGRRRAHFGDVVSGADDVIVAVTMFLAILELVRRRRVVMRQQESFGPIELTSASEME